MKTKLLKSLLAIVCLLCSIGVYAHQFESDGIYYNITSSTDKTVEVTYRGRLYDSYNNEYTGSVVIPDSVTYQDVTYSVTSIGDYAFRECTGLTEITIPNSITLIGYKAFSDCTGLTVVTIPNSVTLIGYKAFSDCTGLTVVTIPNSVTLIGDYAFSGCDGLTTVNFNAESCSTMGTTEGPVFANCTNFTKLNIGESVQTIPASAFSGCTGLTKVTIPNSVTSIGYFAFANCTSLTRLDISENIESLGSDYLYGNQQDLTIVMHSLNPPMHVDPYYGFKKSEWKLIIPSEEVLPLYNEKGWIGEYEIIYMGEFEPFKFEAGGICYKAISNSEVRVISNANKYSGAVIIPSTVEYDGTTYSVIEINESAFKDCTELTSVIIPNSITSIGENAFSGCAGLTSITIPNSVTSIGGLAFHNCTGLTQVTIGNSVTSIGDGAFYNCTGLTEVTIPNSVTSIGNAAFEDCSSLTSVIIPNSVTSIGDAAFYKCTGLTSITIPNSVTSIRSAAFMHCTGLTEVTIGNSVTSIGDYAFLGCESLRTVTIGSAVTEIGEKAFDGCDRIKTVNSYAEVPPTIYSNTFTVYVNDNATLHVVKGCKEAYAEADYWEYFVNITDDLRSVNYVAPEQLQLDKEKITAYVGNTIEVLATLSPDNVTDKFVTWSVSDSTILEIAKVNDLSVEVLVLKEGVANIVATSVDGSNLSATCEVTVEATLATSITLDQTAVTLKATETATLTATVLPETTTNKEVVWTSSDSEVASVENGIVTAHKVGTAIITATTTDGSNLTATCEVTVEATLATSITLDQTTVTLKATETATLTATVLPETTTNKEVVWTSSDSEVASVENGVVTAHKVGTATITATTTDGSNLTATCEVTVEATLATSITLDQTNITAIEGESIVLTATIYPDDATEKGVVWSVSDATIATIEPLNNVSAKVTVLREGVVTITAETIDGSNLSATCTIDVYSDIEALLRDSEDVEYYDLNGFRVENPTRGIYIVKQGDFVRKVFINKSL